MGISPPSFRLDIKAVPNSSKNEVVGWLGDVLKVKVSAPPEEGKANSELLAFLAKTLCLPKGAVRLERGGSSRNKVIEIAGMRPEQVLELLPYKPRLFTTGHRAEKAPHIPQSPN